MIELRDYQKEAISAFEKNNGVGIFEMATGTGKTFTALSVVDKVYQAEQRQFLVIIVPFIHLIDQWTSQFKFFNLDNYVEIYGNKSNWMNKLAREVVLFNHGIKNRVIVIGSYKSIGSLACQNILAKVKSQQFLVADECHYLGSKSYINHSMKQFDKRLGLSATPKRWWDEEGTERLIRTFDKVIYEFSLEKAIKENYLTPYYYYPEIVYLTSEEEEEYQKISIKIGQLMSNSQTKSDKEQIERLLLRRSRIIKFAEDKKIRLIQILSEKSDIKHTLIYCAEGEIKTIYRMVSELGHNVAIFDSTVPQRERQVILKKFADGEIEIILAIKCLDEGVDVPATTCAYFLASTTNPREFVQRRGRVLRKSPNKEFAEIYDFITFSQGESLKTSKSIAEKEMPRFAEFSRYAINEFQARRIIRPLLSTRDMEGLMDILPWEMYKIIKSRGVEET